MSGLNEFLWRANIPWPELVSAAEAVIGRWNTVTDFITHTDRREHIWTVRHASVGQPFIVLNADALRGSVPRIGNPMPLLLLIGTLVMVVDVPPEFTVLRRMTEMFATPAVVAMPLHSISVTVMTRVADPRILKMSVAFAAVVTTADAR